MSTASLDGTSARARHGYVPVLRPPRPRLADALAAVTTQEDPAWWARLIARAKDPAGVTVRCATGSASVVSSLVLYRGSSLVDRACPGAPLREGASMQAHAEALAERGLLPDVAPRWLCGACHGGAVDPSYQRPCPACAGQGATALPKALGALVAVAADPAGVATARAMYREMFAAQARMTVALRVVARAPWLATPEGHRARALARGKATPEHPSQADVLPLGYACAMGLPIETPGPRHRGQWAVLVVPALDDGAAW